MIRLVLFAPLAALLLAAHADACDKCRRPACPAPAACAAPSACYGQNYAPSYETAPVVEYVERTVYEPQTTTEVRHVTVVEQRLEKQERQVNVTRRVAETSMVEQEYVVQVPQTRTRTESYTVMKTVWREVEQPYTIMVPHQEVRQGTRKQCVQVPVKEVRTVCRDMGGWQERVCHAPAPCGSCCSCQGHVRTYKVWVPNYVQDHVEVTVMKTKVIEVPHEYAVTVCKPETRVRTVKVSHVVPEERTREVNYTVCVNETRVRQVPVTKYRDVVETRTETVSVPVSYEVEKEVTVEVCRMVGRKVVVPLSPCYGGAYAPCYSEVHPSGCGCR